MHRTLFSESCSSFVRSPRARVGEVRCESTSRGNAGTPMHDESEGTHTYITINMYRCVLFRRDLLAFLRRPWVASHALGCGARRGPACTPRRKFGSRAGSVARALGVQRREIWQVITGLLSAELEPGKAMENPHVRGFAPLL